MGVAFDDINRCYNGCQLMMGVKTTYTGQKEQETLIDMENSIFCESTKLGGGLLSVSGGLLN